ncbi:nitrite transporter [Pluralibacter gergoviae]
MFDPDKYLSVTWQKGGRLYPKLDCFGIVNEIRGDLGLPKFPDFAGVTKDDGGLNREALAYMPNLTPCEPHPGALAMCYTGSMVTHVAVVVRLNGELRAAESNPKTNVTFLPLGRFLHKFVKVEFYQ